jgi:hypothetical protein
MSYNRKHRYNVSSSFCSRPHAQIPSPFRAWHSGASALLPPTFRGATRTSSDARDILLTEEEETYIRGQMDPVNATFSLSLGTSEIACQTERYQDSMEHLDYEQSLRAARDGDNTPRCRAPAADMASQTQEHSMHPFIPTLLTLPPSLPPFIPKFSSRLMICRRSI